MTSLLFRLLSLTALLVALAVPQSGCSECENCEGYEELFEGGVTRLDIRIEAARYDEALADLEEVLCCGLPGPDQEPLWVPAVVRHGDKEWPGAAFRFKGNSSLSIPYDGGARKLPFRLNFKKLSQDGKTFHGFTKLTFANGFHDPTMIRERLAADVFREAGVPVARMTFASIYVDVGDGPRYWGVYTMIEDPTDVMMASQFGDGTGNLYKPDGASADWSSFDTSSFDKKSNSADADFSDVMMAIEALHQDRGDPAAWRSELEAHVDVHGFLTWLAVNQSMVNWDTYGWMRHNYYLYGDPGDAGRLRLIPWDLNESLAEPRAEGADLVMADSVGTRWPLIRYLLDDSEYRSFYRSELSRIAQGAFSEGFVDERIQRYRAEIEPYVNGQLDAEEFPYRLVRPEDFAAAFDAEDGLRAHIASRHDAIAQALASVD